MDARPMRVVHIGFFLDPQERTPARILVDWWPLVDTAEIVARAGADVTVIQACTRSETVIQRGVTYHFLSRDSGRSTLAGSRGFARLIESLRADVFHIHGLCFPADVIALSQLAPGTPILLQDHANGIPRFWRRRVHRHGMSRAAGVAFCALDQAKPFLGKALIQPHTPIFAIPECSSRFLPGDQQSARSITGLYGDPAVLWVGHLDANKDPLTVLAGISEAARRLPNLQLWCCYGTAPLLPEVKRRIAQDPRLTTRVHLVGNVPHERVEQLMRAADLFVLGSHREGSGCSVIEALACGLPPVITAIPSFRALTGEGRVGALWSCDEPGQLCEALLSSAGDSIRVRRSEVRTHFDRELSFDALGRQLLAAYQDLTARHRQGAAGLAGSCVSDTPAVEVGG
jgi:glycosyltransferase involved in cell wall biosynthesis